MASSGNDYNEKSHPPHQNDETPIARGIRTHPRDDCRKDSVRKQSVVASLKNAYKIEKPVVNEESDSIKIGYDSTHRKLKPRHIQLIGIGGTIGTALEAFSMAVPEVCFSPSQYSAPSSCASPSAWLRWSRICQYPRLLFALLGDMSMIAFGVAAGYNFFIFEALLGILGLRKTYSFSANAGNSPIRDRDCNGIVHYWSDVVPAGPIIAIVIVIHAFIKLFAVQGCGESEFWLALRKMLLIIGLIIYTFITILGGNPLHDRFQEVRSDPPRNYFVKYFDKVFS